LADGILLERAGIPSVSVCTSAFKITADAMARNLGFPGYQYVMLQHPIASRTEAEIDDMVRNALADILRVLGAGLTYQESR
jgi:thioesterase domain-containing protein